ncbi:unnamed protein product, partial [Mesorhabditis spiculigera]
MSSPLSRVVDAHAAGNELCHVSIAIEPNGDRFLTSAKDVWLHIWRPSVFRGNSEVECHEMGIAGQASLCWKDDALYIGLWCCDPNTGIDKRCVVRIAESKSGWDGEQRSLFSFPMEINAIDVSKTYIAAIGSDCTMKKAPLDQTASYEKIEFGNQPLSLAIDPTEKYIAISFTDGSVEIYPTSGTERLAVFEKLFKAFTSIHPLKNRAQLKWSPDGKHLYMPAWDGIRVADVSNWECQRTRFNKSKDFEEEFSALALREDGAYLAAGTLFGTICVWHTSSGKLISTQDYRNNNKMTAVCALAFLHNGKDLCIADIKQGVSLWYGAVDKDAQVKNKPSKPLIIDEAMEDDDFSNDGVIQKRRVVQDSDDDAAEPQGSESNFGENDENSRMSVDIGAIKRRYTQHDNLEEEIDFRDDDDAFKPVAYHDSAISSEIVVSNEDTRYTMADLSPEAIVLACKARKEAQSEIYVHRVGTWDREKITWTVRLPFGEEAIDVLATSQLIFVLTTQHNIRAFSLDGTQRQIWSHPGSMASACAYGNSLAIASFTGGPQWYLYCRGSRVPLVDLRLIPDTAAWEMPLCDVETDKGRLESQLLLAEQKMVLMRAAEVDTTSASNEHTRALMQLFALALKMNREARAVEMARFAASSRTVQAMVKYAARKNRDFMVNKLNELGNELEEEMEHAAPAAEQPQQSTRRSDAHGRKEVPSMVPKKVVPKKRESTMISAEAEAVLARGRLDVSTNEESQSQALVEGPKFGLDISGRANPFQKSNELEEEKEHVPAAGASMTMTPMKDLVLYHDSSVSNEDTRYTMADLSPEAIVLACKARKEAQSEIYVHRVGTWDREKITWTVRLPFGEEAIDVLATSQLIFVVTSQHNIRTFSLDGTQRQIWSHPAMTAPLSRIFDSHGAGIGEAHIDIAVEPSGDRFLTSAKDGSIWIWKPSVFSGDAQVTQQEIGEAGHACLCWKDDALYIGLTVCDQNTGIDKRCVVRIAESKSGWDGEQRSLFSFPMEINAIDVSKTYIAAIGSDCTMKKAPLDQAASYEKIEFGNQPLSLAIDPMEKYIAISFTDGSVEVYPTSGTERLAVFEKLFKSFGDIDPHKNRAQLKWSPDGKHLYMPAWDGIRVADVSNWECQRTRFNKSKDFEEEFSALALSEDGAYLAAGTLFGTICVWHTSSGKLISTHDYRNNNKMTAVCALAFLHNGKDLCIADIKQGVSLWYGAVDKDAQVKNKPSKHLIIDEAMEDDDFSNDGVIQKRRVVQDSDDDAAEPQGSESNVGENDENSRMSVDIGAIKRRYTQHDNLEEEIDFRDDDDAFKPVAYHDSAISSEIVVSNEDTRYTMADLSPEAIVLACKARKEAQSEIYVHRVGTWDREKITWTVRLPFGEEAIDVLATSQLIFVLTSQHNIRAFSLDGAQRQIWSHPGCLRLLTPADQWVPIFTAGARLLSRFDVIWPFSVLEDGRHEIRYLYCRGSRVPLVDLRLIPDTAAWEMPLCDVETDKGRLESQLLLAEQKMVLMRAAEVDTTSASNEHTRALMQLFALALKMNREARAVEMARFAASSRTVQAMVKYAARQNRSFMVNKLNELGNELEEEMEHAAAAAEQPQQSTRRSDAHSRKEVPAMVPKKVVLKKRESTMISAEAEAVLARGRLDVSTNEESQSQALVEGPKFGLDISGRANPFQKNADIKSLDNSSVFEQLDSPVDRKRVRDTQASTATPKAKQPRLSSVFSVASKENREDKRGAFGLWLTENEETCREEFTGDEVRFPEYCQQKFRMLPAAQKKEWKAKAEAS